MPIALSFDGEKKMIYQNVTPAKFVKGRDDFAKLLQDGIDALPELCKSFKHVETVSQFSAAQLKESGAEDIVVNPIEVSSSRWDITPDFDLMAKLQDGKTNIIFVGRIEGNKRQDLLIKAYQHYREINPNSRLTLIGGGNTRSAYYRNVRQLASNTTEVEMAGKVSENILAAYYRCADLYWSFTEHEGYGVPFVEASMFGIPAMAYECSAVGETVAPNSVLFNSAQDLESLAALAHALILKTNNIA